MSEPSAKLDSDPLMVASANAVTELNTDGTEALRRWRNDRTVVDEINQLAKDADLTDSLVIEIEFEERLLGLDGWKHPDRWRIRVNHPVPTRNPITVYLGKFPLVHARAALHEIVKYLGDWQSARAEQLNLSPGTEGGGSAAQQVAVKPPMTDGQQKLWSALNGCAMTAKELAAEAELDTSEETVRQWVSGLRKAGYKIDNRPGRGYFRPDAPPADSEPPTAT